MKFRKRPVVIEAMLYDGTMKSIETIGDWAKSPPGEDAWISWVTTDGVRVEDPLIHTLEGEMHVSPGDWIIKGVQGEFYPCKPDIFVETYEPVDGDDA